MAAPFVLACALSWTRPGLAQDQPKKEQGYSAYEAQTVAAILGARGGAIEPEPEGKVIERVEVVRLEVFDEDDPVPDFFNVFHTTTREVVIRRELLFEVGEPFTEERAAETERNLRERRQLSLVLIVPVRGSAPDRVRVLVVTKDVWSLRLNSAFAVGTGGLSYLLLNPSEENAFGTHASVGALFILYPESYSIGLLGSHHRIAGTRLEGSLNANLSYNRDTGRSEGSFGSFTYGQPLYSTTVDWGFGTAIFWRNEITRIYEGDKVKTFDAPSTSGDDQLPIQYKTDRQIGGYEATRSFGRSQKYDFSLGLEADRRQYQYTPPPGTPEQAVSEFELEWLPVSDTRISPFLQLRSYSTKFFSTIELETLGLQEDYRLGPTILLRVFPASTELGSTRNLIGTMVGLSYTLPLGDGLVRAVASNTIAYDFQGKDDALLSLALRVASPRFGLGRLIVDGVLQNRYENYLRRKFYLGGDGRLRGYPQNEFFGGTAAAANVELRTKSVDILSAQVGMAAFYDVGDAAEELSDLSFKHSVGLGVRVLFPQANRSVFRFDWAFPLSPGYDTLPGAAFITFEQAFPMPELVPPTVTSFVTDTE